MSFHNRCIVSGANGPLTLSVPVEGGRDQKRSFHEIRIANRENWQRTHWRSLVSSYNRSPWFEHYKDSLSGLYQTPFKLLIDWNQACLEWSLSCLKADLRWEFSKTYQKEYAGEEVVDMRGRITPRSYPVIIQGFAEGKDEPETTGISPGNGTGTGTEDAVPREGMAESIVYSQVFSGRQGFIPNLSILDLLFCEGGKGAFSLLTKDR